MSIFVISRAFYWFSAINKIVDIEVSRFESIYRWPRAASKSSYNFCRLFSRDFFFCIFATVSFYIWLCAYVWRLDFFFCFFFMNVMKSLSVLFGNWFEPCYLNCCWFCCSQRDLVVFLLFVLWLLIQLVSSSLEW